MIIQVIVCHISSYLIKFFQCPNSHPYSMVRLFQLILAQPRFHLNKGTIPLQEWCMINHYFFLNSKWIVIYSSYFKHVITNFWLGQLIFSNSGHSVKISPHSPSKKGRKSLLYIILPILTFPCMHLLWIYLYPTLFKS